MRFLGEFAALTWPFWKEILFLNYTLHFLFLRLFLPLTLSKSSEVERAKQNSCNLRVSVTDSGREWD